MYVLIVWLISVRWTNMMEFLFAQLNKMENAISGFIINIYLMAWNWAISAISIRFICLSCTASMKKSNFLWKIHSTLIVGLMTKSSRHCLSCFHSCLSFCHRLNFLFVFLSQSVALKNRFSKLNFKFAYLLLVSKSCAQMPFNHLHVRFLLLWPLICSNFPLLYNLLRCCCLRKRHRAASKRMYY